MFSRSLLALSSFTNLLRGQTLSLTWHSKDHGLLAGEELASLDLILGSGAVDGDVWDLVANLHT